MKLIRENIEICNKCPIYNDGHIQSSVRKTCKVNPRLISNINQKRVLFFGEAPGENEDKQDLAFVGAAGKKFDELLKETGLIKFDIRISNVVKCRPIKVEDTKYKNRAPSDMEVEICSAYMDEDWSFDPHLVIALGRVPTKALFPNEEPAAIRGKGQKFKYKDKEYLVLPTYHPAATIYDPSTRKTLYKHLNNATRYLEMMEQT